MEKEMIETIPNTPLLSEIFPHTLQNWPSRVHFKGWKCPQKKWKEWVDRLVPKYAVFWNQTGICDAIMSSIYSIPCNRIIVLGLSEFWCTKTNTFVFPWGEATVTLEDVMILAGLPVIGDHIGDPLNEDMKKLVQEMEVQRSQMCKSKLKKATHCMWLKRFMGETCSDLEHVGFLSLWLSRFVFPSISEDSIGRHVFPIAARLSMGEKVALAPALLSRIYHDLRTIKQGMLGLKNDISVSGPFRLLQIWAFERFPLLGPEIPNTLTCGEPRIALWHKLTSKVTNFPLVRSVLRMKQNFQWRPYSADVKNWKHLSFYAEFEQIFCDDLSLDLELRSFYRCLQACEFLGIDCKEKYSPYRVAMQFGLDQEIPAYLETLCLKFGFYVPKRTYKPCVTSEYAIWWKNMMVTRDKAVQVVLMEKIYENIMNSLCPIEANDTMNDFRDSVSLPRACVKLEKQCSSSDDQLCLSKISSPKEVKKSVAKSSVKIEEILISSSSDDEDLLLYTRIEHLSHTADIRNFSVNPSPMNIDSGNRRKVIPKSELIGSKHSPSTGKENVKVVSATTQSKVQKSLKTPIPALRRSVHEVTKETSLPVSRNNILQQNFPTEYGVPVVTKRPRSSSVRKRNIGLNEQFMSNIPGQQEEECNTQKPVKERKRNSQNSFKKKEGDLPKVLDSTSDVDMFVIKKRARYERSINNHHEPHQDNCNMRKLFKETKGNSQNSLQKTRKDLQSLTKKIDEDSQKVMDPKGVTIEVKKMVGGDCLSDELDDIVLSERIKLLGGGKAAIKHTSTRISKKPLRGDFHCDSLDFIILSERIKPLNGDKKTAKSASFRKPNMKTTSANTNLKTASETPNKKTALGNFIVKTGYPNPNAKTSSKEPNTKTSSGNGEV